MGHFIILFLGGVVGFLFGFAVSLPHLKKILRILQTPLYSRHTISNGKIVQISGKVCSELRSLSSPLTRTDCALWQVEVQKYISGDESGSWETIFKETSAHPFEVSNSSESLKVYPTDAELMLRTDFQKESGPLVGDFEPILQTAVDKLISSLTLRRDFTSPLKVFERTIKANETIFILGKIQEKSGVRYISSSKDGAPFLISDRNPYLLLGGLYLRVVVSISVLTALGVFLAQYVASEI